MIDNSVDLARGGLNCYAAEIPTINSSRFALIRVKRRGERGAKWRGEEDVILRGLLAVAKRRRLGDGSDAILL